jgi:hypothetical protein
MVRFSNNQSSSQVIAPAARCCGIQDRLPDYPAQTRLQYSVVSLHGIMRSGGMSDALTVGSSTTNDSATGHAGAGDSTAGRAPTDTTAGQPPVDTTASQPPADTSGGHAATDSSAAPRTDVRPAVVPPAARVKVGGSLLLGKTSALTGLHLQTPRWSSLNESVATVDSRGRVVGRAAGFTYIVAVGLTRGGAVASLVQRVDVGRP